MDQAGTYLALVAASFLVGYCTGRVKSRPLVYDHTLSNSGNEGTSSNSTGGSDISSIDTSDECKLVFIVRMDLGMSAGKIAAQCSHATLACYKSLLSTNPMLLRQWERSGQVKIAFRCKDEDELLLLQAQAQSLNLCAHSIQDAGRTQIAAGSRTVLGIAGPGQVINIVSSKLDKL